MFSWSITVALVTYIEHNGRAHEVQVRNGDSVMQGAVDNMVAGIVGECGGGLACATCHCYVDDAWAGKLDAPADIEIEMLANTSSERRAGSRLSCQISVSDELDGLVVRLPETQF
jgi:2Fe-2S ferredoxin